MKKLLKILPLCGLFLLSPGARAQNTYTNPVMDFDMPDPTVICADDGSFYLYATEGHGYSIPIVRSFDLVNWERVGAAFSKETRPTFEPKGGLWAPDINRLKKNYLLYYSMSYWGGSKTCGIGVATADNPQGPFKDHGPLFRSNTIGVFNSIDPEFVRERGRNYLFWGSFWGIYAVELTKDGLAVKAGSEPKQIAGGAFEATYIHKRDGYYYLFASIGSCCEGLNSTYTTVVGRSRSLMGPYTDKSGKGMTTATRWSSGAATGSQAPGTTPTSSPTRRATTGCSITPWIPATRGAANCCSTRSSGSTDGRRSARDTLRILRNRLPFFKP